MKTLVVSEITRPSLEIQETKQIDGSPVTAYWSAVDFKTDRDKDEVMGNHSCIRLQWADNTKEIWEFHKATVMLSPKPKDNPCRYVMTYDKVQRVSQ
jgi:hypothetical protein